MSSGTGVNEDFAKTLGLMMKTGRVFKRDGLPAYAMKLNDKLTEFVEDEAFTNAISKLYGDSKKKLPESLPPAQGTDEFDEQKIMEKEIVDLLMKNFDDAWRKDCRYIVMDLLDERNNSKIRCFRWNADNAELRHKMVFASGASGLKGKLNLQSVIQVDSKDELIEKIQEEKAKK